MSRVLALDHGEARCGVAVSDPTGTIVTPLQAIERPDSRTGLDQLSRICSDRSVEVVVVGLPIGLNGAETQQTADARRFADRLRGRLPKLQIEHLDERMTTAEAARLGGAADEDSRAAAVLLERWLATRRAG